MEKLGDILKRERIRRNISGDVTDTSSTAASPEDATQETDCPECRGIGWVTLKLPFGHPDFGKAFPCICAQKEWEEQKADRLRRYSNLGPLARMTFDNLIPSGRSPDPENQRLFGKAFEAAKGYAEEPRGWLVLTGPSGSGKTHLGAAIANRSVELGLRVFFMVVPDLLDHLRATFGPGSDTTYDELFEQVRNVPLLVLDDLGTQTSSPWASEKLFQVLNHRFNAQLPTVVTTNVPLERLDENLYSRLTDPELSRVYQTEKRATRLDALDSLLLPLPASMSFNTFKPAGHNLSGRDRINLEGAFRVALTYAESTDGWLVLMGPSGRGKTHLAAAIAHYQRDRGTEVLFLLVSDLLDYLRSTYHPDSKISYDTLFKKVRTVPLLVLDDYGEQDEKLWAKEKLYQIINHRYNARLPTVITTRLSLDEIDSRVSSRLADPELTTFFAITAPNYPSGNVAPSWLKREAGQRRRSR